MSWLIGLGRVAAALPVVKQIVDGVRAIVRPAPERCEDERGDFDYNGRCKHCNRSSDLVRSNKGCGVTGCPLKVINE